MKVIILAAVASLLATTANAQSFNCRYAKSPDEILICQDARLSALDVEMSNLYFGLRNSLGGYRRANLDASQRQWLYGRMSCGRDYGCVYNAYTRRIAVLQNY